MVVISRNFTEQLLLSWLLTWVRNLRKICSGPRLCRQCRQHQCSRTACCRSVRWDECVVSRYPYQHPERLRRHQQQRQQQEWCRRGRNQRWADDVESSRVTACPCGHQWYYLPRPPALLPWHAAEALPRRAPGQLTMPSCTRCALPTAPTATAFPLPLPASAVQHAASFNGWPRGCWAFK